MRVITAQVVEGKVEVPGDVEDGTTVAILAPGSGGFELSEDEERELAAALEEIRSGAYVDGADLLKELRGVSAG